MWVRLRFFAALSIGGTVVFAGAIPSVRGDQPTVVAILRVPNGGIQPQVTVDARGVVHLIYFSGDPRAGDIFYVRSTDGGMVFSRPLQVNTRPASAIAVGNIRGAHVAVGKNQRVHVAWMGSGETVPKGPHGASPMLYTRLNDEGTAFEPERNIVHSAVGLDGGGSVAADDVGNVYVAWHAPPPGAKGEGSRCVWVSRSTDEGKTFSAEERALTEPTGACGCCGMRAFADHRGSLYLLYRAANRGIHRDMYLLTSADRGVSFRGEKIHDWEVAGCPMSTAALAEGEKCVLAAWESDGQVYYAPVGAGIGDRISPITAPGSTGERKHPVVASSKQGETILVWTEGMGWERGGTLAWQVFSKDGKPTGVKGTAKGVPIWSLVAVFARPDGGFTVVY
jgi:hypothetical protein